MNIYNQLIGRELFAFVNGAVRVTLSCHPLRSNKCLLFIRQTTIAGAEIKGFNNPADFATLLCINFNA